MKKIALSLTVLAASGAYVLMQPTGGVDGDPLAAPLPEAAAAPLPLSPQISDGSDAKPAAPKSEPAVDRVDTRRPRTSNETTAAITPPQPSMSEQPSAARPAQAAPSTKNVLDRISPPPSANVPVATPQPPTPAPAAATQEATASALPEPQFPPLPRSAVPVPQPRPAYSRPPVRLVQYSSATQAGTYRDGTYDGPAADAYYGIVQIQAVVKNGRLTELGLLQWPNDRQTSVRINRQALPMLRDEAIRAQSANVDIISGATLTSRAFIRSLGGALRQAGQ